VNGVDKYFIKYFLQSGYFIDYANNSATGSTIKNVPLSAMRNLEIPLPPLSEQTLIVAKLDALFARIDKSIALLEENIKHTKALMASVLEEVFGNGNSWKREPLNQVAKVERGKSKHRPRNDARLFGGIYPFVQTGDVRSADKYIKKYEVCYSEFGLKQSKLWKKGTICLTIAANIGDVAILGFDSCFPDSVVGITPKEMNNEFLFYYLKTLQLQLDKKANSAAQKNINLEILSEIDVPIPPIKIQNIIAKWFTSLEENQFKILSTQQSKLVYLKALKSSLLDRAFKGEL
jgi:type I restriction enzyme S subunit